MKPSNRFFISAVALLFVAGTTIDARAITFSLSLPSPTPFMGDEILVDPGAPAPAPAATIIPAAGAAETDAFTYAHFGTADETTLYFSVDSGSAGAVGSAVALEAAGAGGGPGDHPADVFASTGAGLNFLVWDGDGVANPGAAANIGIVEPVALPGDNLDGLDMRIPGIDIYWSVDPATIAGSPPYAGGSPANIYISPVAPGYSGGPFGVYALEAALGLLPGDDIDALEILEDGVPGFLIGADSILFSLAPGSATLLGLGASGADVLGVGGVFGPAPVVVAPAGALGLLPTDNIDAFALDVIPEPGRALLLALGAIAVFARRRRI
ncbi:MAG: PEP-CTERM sorting domain-containing protein [Verrucomicrobiales bacterium]